MDGNQTERKSISLTKDDEDARPRMREAYPVYRQNTDRETLERQEYRNAPVQESFQYRQTAPQYQQQTPPPYQQDPLPAQNRYGSPQVQPTNSPAQNRYSNDDLGRYYDYEYNYAEPERPSPVQPNIPSPPPQVAMPPAQQLQQQSMKFCKYCGERIPADAVICTHCGRQVEELKGAPVNRQAPVQQPYFANPGMYEAVSDKSKSTSIILAAIGFFGLGGLHRFYVGKPLSGILYLISGGLFGIGTLVDILKLASGTFSDGSNKLIKKQ